jgi:hypothetical protein
MDLQGSLRLFRMVLITGMATFLAAAGHVLGGGALPDLGIMAVLVVPVLVPVAWLTRSQLSFMTLLSRLGSGQLMLHEAFTFLSSRPLCLPSLADQMPHHGQVMGLGCSAALPVSMPAGMGSGAGSPVMLAGHVLALLATAWLLRKGEVALWQLLAWLRPLMQLPRPAGIIPVRHWPVAPDRVFVPARWRNFRHDSLRGPPAAASRAPSPISAEYGMGARGR